MATKKMMDEKLKNRYQSIDKNRDLIKIRQVPTKPLPKPKKRIKSKKPNGGVMRIMPYEGKTY